MELILSLQSIKCVATVQVTERLRFSSLGRLENLFSFEVLRSFDAAN